MNKLKVAHNLRRIESNELDKMVAGGGFWADVCAGMAEQRLDAARQGDWKRHKVLCYTYVSMCS